MVPTKAEEEDINGYLQALDEGFAVLEQERHESNLVLREFEKFGAALLQRYHGVGTGRYQKGAILKVDGVEVAKATEGVFSSPFQPNQCFTPVSLPQLLKDLGTELCAPSQHFFEQKEVRHVMALALALVLSTAPSRAAEIQGQIQALKPEVNKAYSWKVARQIDRVAREFDLPPHLLVAIVRVESYFVPRTPGMLASAVAW